MSLVLVVVLNKYLTIAIEAPKLIAAVDPLSFNMCKHASGNKACTKQKRVLYLAKSSDNLPACIRLLLNCCVEDGNADLLAWQFFTRLNSARSGL